MISLCLCGFSPGAPVSLTVKTGMLGLSQVSTLNRGTGSETGVGALWLPTAPQGQVKCRAHISLYNEYVTNKVPLTYCGREVGTALVVLSKICT